MFAERIKFKPLVLSFSNALKDLRDSSINQILTGKYQPDSGSRSTSMRLFYISEIMTGENLENCHRIAKQQSKKNKANTLHAVKILNDKINAKEVYQYRQGISGS
ncbi:hypothetical protein E5288_WYG001586 [Bos mutus]|uniref:Uncharacterized protein n=1 Tax=Bos mutus TaxID=72004 RepID=A0A6B0RBT4_9CETA|nr:hypothetical protein [Bos mutus]